MRMPVGGVCVERAAASSTENRRARLSHPRPHTQHPSWWRMVLQRPLLRSAPRETSHCGDLGLSLLAPSFSSVVSTGSYPLSLSFQRERHLSSEGSSAFHLLSPCVSTECLCAAGPVPGTGVAGGGEVAMNPHPCPRGCVIPALWAILDWRAGSDLPAERAWHGARARAQWVIDTGQVGLVVITLRSAFPLEVGTDFSRQVIPMEGEGTSLLPTE